MAMFDLVKENLQPFFKSINHVLNHCQPTFWDFCQISLPEGQPSRPARPRPRRRLVQNLEAGEGLKRMGVLGEILATKRMVLKELKA
jgi:hypothetical protein